MPPRRKPPTSNGSVPRAVSLASHLPGFENYLRAECGLARNTLIAYRADLERYCEWYSQHGPALLSELNVAHFTLFLQSLQELGLATSTMARHLVSVKMFFRYLMLEGLVKESLVELVNSPRLWEHLPKVLSPEKVNQLIAGPVAQDRSRLRDRALLALLYATGCRASEVCNLRLQDLYLEEGYCRCLGKGNKERIVSLNPVARAAIEAYLIHERPKSLNPTLEEPVLLTRRGTPLDRIMVWKLVKRYAARIGVSKNVSPHTLRHSFATHMLAGGAEIRALQELLGHASIRTTQVYTHVDHSRLKAIHEQCHPRG